MIVPNERQGESPMDIVVEGQREKIGELRRRHAVQRLALFGSAVRDDFDPERSDLDFLVEFTPAAPQDHADAYFGLLADLRPSSAGESTSWRRPRFGTRTAAARSRRPRSFCMSPRDLRGAWSSGHDRRSLLQPA
jgi:predicted nucleotidyltransferase